MLQLKQKKELVRSLKLQDKLFFVFQQF